MSQPSFPLVRARRRSAGVGLVTAIFLLVVLAALGVAMVSIFTTQQAGSTLDEQGARAYQAARAGVEWGLYQRLRIAPCPASPAVATTSFQFPAGSSLAGFTVTVTCQDSGPAPATRTTITSTACNLQPAGGSCPTNPINNPDYVQRRLEVNV